MVHAWRRVKGHILLLTDIMFKFTGFERTEIGIIELFELFTRVIHGKFGLINVYTALFAGYIGLGWESTSTVNRVFDPDVISLVLNRPFFVCFTQVDHPVVVADIWH